MIEPDGRVIRGGRAVLRVFGGLGWWPITTPLSWPPMIWFVELGYRVVANNRILFSKFFFRTDHDKD